MPSNRGSNSDRLLGLVILFALIVSGFTLLFAWFWASKIASRVFIDPNPELTEDAFAERLKSAPSAFKAFLPILVPILLIVSRSFADFLTPSSAEGVLHPFRETATYQFINFIGAPLIALLIGIGIAITLPKKFDKAILSSTGWVGEGMLAAAIIIMITGAGGAFGMVLRGSGVADLIGNKLSSPALGLWLPFIAAAAIRTAQGSSTVAIMTTAPILAPMLENMGLDSSLGRVLCVLALGAGAMFGSHANDSFFWVVTQMSGMDVKTGYKLHTTGTILMGIFSCTIIWIIGLIVL